MLYCERDEVEKAILNPSYMYTCPFHDLILTSGGRYKVFLVRNGQMIMMATQRMLFK